MCSIGWPQLSKLPRKKRYSRDCLQLLTEVFASVFNSKPLLQTIAAVCLVGAACAFGQEPTGTAETAVVPNPAPAHPQLRGVFDDFGGKAGMTA